MQTVLPRLHPRERPRRRSQPRHRPAGRRPFERRGRGGREQHQGRARDPASVRPAAVRRGPRPALPHADRHRRQSERRRGRRHRHRGPVDQARRRRHRGDRQAGHRLRHRAARRPRHDHARVEGREGVRAVGEREGARGMRALRAVGVDEMRRIGHDVGLRRESDGRRRVRQALRSRLHAGVRRDHRAHRRRADRRRALPRRPRACRLHARVRSLPGGREPPQDVRPVGLAADQGQHRRRTDDDRGEGARQHPEDRAQVHRRRRARQGRDADRIPGCGSWTARRPRPRWSRCARRRDSSCTSSRRGRATSSATRSCR